MYEMRLWSARHARSLAGLYKALECVLSFLHPLFARIGYQRLDRYFLAIEKAVKGFLFDSQSCGQCTLKYTGMSCPMNCPKRLRNGPCGGVRQNGNCEVVPDMPCVWVVAWEGRRRLNAQEQVVRLVLPPVDERLANSSAWLREVRKRQGYPELESVTRASPRAALNTDSGGENDLRAMPLIAGQGALDESNLRPPAAVPVP